MAVVAEAHRRMLPWPARGRAEEQNAETMTRGTYCAPRKVERNFGRDGESSAGEQHTSGAGEPVRRWGEEKEGVGGTSWRRERGLLVPRAVGLGRRTHAGS